MKLFWCRSTLLTCFRALMLMLMLIVDVKGMDPVRLALNTRDSNKPSTECVLEGLQICLYNNNTLLDKNYLLQKHETARGAPNYFLHSDIAIKRLDRLIE